MPHLRLPALALALSAGLLLPHAAWAEDDLDGTSTTPTRSTHSPGGTLPVLDHPTSTWFGLQTLLVDAIGLGVASGASGSGSGAFGIGAGIVGGVTWFLGSPLLHALHGQGGVAIASFGLHALLPFGMGALFQSQWGSGLLGALLGLLTASTLDAAVLAWEPDAHTRSSSEPATSGWQPMVQVLPGGATAGLSGRF